MVCIDVFSRYMWVKPLKNRQNLHIALEQVFLEMKRDFGDTPKNMTSDNEFRSRKLDALAAKYKFRWWYGDREEKFRTGIVEKSIKTLKDLIKRYLTQNNTKKYIDVFEDFVYNYNHTMNGTINTRPAVAIKTGQTFAKPEKDTLVPLEIGDKVRVLIRRKVFTKGDSPYYSKHVYKIVKREGNRYKVENLEWDGDENQPDQFVPLHLEGDVVGRRIGEQDGR